MKDALAKVREFHAVFGVPTSDMLELPPLTGGGSEYMFDCYEGMGHIAKVEGDAKDVRVLRTRLILEEVSELVEAEAFNDLIKIADALADIIYIVLGTALVYGIPLDRVFDEVHRSNMAKAPDGVVTLREDGKVMKPTGWTSPDIEGALYGRDGR